MAKIFKTMLLFVSIFYFYNSWLVSAENCTDTSIPSDALSPEGCNVVNFDLSLSSSTQQDLLIFSNVTTVNGDIQIYQNSDLTSLEGFHSLTFVRGDFHLFRDDKIRTLDALSNLITVGDDFYVEGSPMIDSLGCMNLKTVGNLIIQDNDGLSSLTGLNSLTHVDKKIDIKNNQNLVNLEGLNGLETIGSGLWIDLNPSLRSLEALSGVKNIGQSLNIQNTNFLESLYGLHNLETVGRHFFDTESGKKGNKYFCILFIYNNVGLVSLDLYSLKVVTKILQLNENKSLRSLKGLENITKIGELQLLLNPSFNCENVCNQNEIWKLRMVSEKIINDHCNITMEPENTCIYTSSSSSTSTSTSISKSTSQLTESKEITDKIDTETKTTKSEINVNNNTSIDSELESNTELDSNDNSGSKSKSNTGLESKFNSVSEFSDKVSSEESGSKQITIQKVLSLIVMFIGYLI